MKQVTFKVRRKGEALLPIGWDEVELFTGDAFLKELFPWDGRYCVTATVAPEIGVFRLLLYPGYDAFLVVTRWTGKGWRKTGFNVCVPALRTLPLNTPLTVDTEWLGK